MEESKSKSKSKRQSKSRLVLIDGNAIMHRAYHALPPLTNRNGELLNAVYGFCTMLFKVIADLEPDFLAVAFDTPEPTFRKMEYLGYQSKRPIMEEGLSSQFGRVHEVLEVMKIPIFEKRGFEADDVIGTLVKRATRDTKKNKKTSTLSLSCSPALIDEVIIVTGDRDLFQLAGPKVKIFAPVKGLSEAQLLDEKQVEEKMGIEPSQIVDYKGLVGDAADNYPGVPGIGPKTAVELLDKYGNLEGVYRALDKGLLGELGKIGEKLMAGKELGFLSKRLATIVTNTPIEIDFKKCEFNLSDIRREEAIAKLKELRFKSLVERLEPHSVLQSRTSRGKGKKDNGQLGLL